jgi:acetyltransferase-like isoleucine patch superfamily enzyme
MIGLKIGKNSHISIANVDIMDPCLVEIGEDTYIGSFSVIGSHVLEGDKIIIGKIIIGNNVKIGTHCVVMPGVTIGENSIIGAYSFVNKDIPADVLAYGIPIKVRGKIR